MLWIELDLFIAINIRSLVWARKSSDPIFVLPVFWLLGWHRTDPQPSTFKTLFWTTNILDCSLHYPSKNLFWRGSYLKSFFILFFGPTHALRQKNNSLFLIFTTAYHDTLFIFRPIFSWDTFWLQKKFASMIAVILHEPSDGDASKQYSDSF